MSPDTKVRRASLAHLDALLALERACSGAAHWSPAAWRALLQQEDTAVVARAVFVAGSDESLLGFLVVHRVAESAELENLAVRPENRRQGVAAALCRAAIAWASAETAGARAAGTQVKEMHLEVRASNRAALQLYASLGFLAQGRRAAYYSNPVEDAVLMRRSLGSSLRAIGNSAQLSSSPWESHRPKV